MPKLPVGRMVTPKQGLAGVRINKNGTFDVLMKKANPRKRKSAKKRTAKKRPNPSVRKSKKTFKSYAKRLGVKLGKRVPRKLTHTKGNKRTTKKRKR